MLAFTVFLVSCIIAFIFTKPTIYWAKRFNLVTDSTKRKHPAHTHTGIIPRAGGVPIFLALLITSLIFIPDNKIIHGILLASFLIVSMGLLDDYYDLSPYLRLFGNIFIAVLVIGFGLGIPYVSNPFGGVIHLDQWKISFEFFGNHTFLIVSNFLAIGWLVFMMNMVNWSKGVDGQLPGFVAITALFLGILSQRFTGHDISVQSVALLSFIVAGAFAGFLPFNFYPQKIMPGYGGGALAGFLLGVLSILSFGKLGTAILVLAIPLIDAIYVGLRRLKNKKSPFKGDKSHLHHKLLEIGWGRRRIAIFYWLVSLFLGISSLFLQGIEKLLAFLAIAVFLLIFVLVIERMKNMAYPKLSEDDGKMWK